MKKIKRQEPGEVDGEWITELWSAMFNCSGIGNVGCMSGKTLNQSTTPVDWWMPETSRNYDGVYVFAHALHNAIADNCPDVFLKSPDQSPRLKQCMANVDLLRYLKASRFT